MFIQYMNLRREIKVNFEMLCIWHWSNKGILKTSGGESVFRWEMKWSQFHMPRVWDKDSSHQSKMLSGCLEEMLVSKRPKQGMLVWKSV